MSDEQNALVSVKTEVQAQQLFAYLIENPGATGQELADHLGISRPSLYRLMGSNVYQEMYQTLVKAPLRKAAQQLANGLPSVVNALINDATNAPSARDRSYAASVIVNFFGMEPLELAESAGIRINFSPTTINVVNEGDIVVGKSPNEPRSKEEIIEAVVRRIED